MPSVIRVDELVPILLTTHDDDVGEEWKGKKKERKEDDEEKKERASNCSHTTLDTLRVCAQSTKMREHGPGGA